MARTAQLVWHNAYCPITLSFLVLKSGQLIANQIWELEFFYSYD